MASPIYTAAGVLKFSADANGTFLVAPSSILWGQVFSASGRRKLLLAQSTGDPYSANVVFLCRFDGSDAATTFTDESDSAHTITAVGNAQLDTAQQRFGASSLLLDGVGDYATISSSADFDLTGDYTIEGFFRSVDVTQNKALVQFWVTDQNNRITVGHINGTLYFFSALPGNGAIRISGGTPTDNTWHHFALTKEAGTWRLFLDGTLIGSSTTTFYPTGNLAVSIGAAITEVPFAGHLDELRFTKGVARYTTSFTPPAVPYP